MSVRIEPFDGASSQWVVAQAEAELIARYGFLADSETGLLAAVFDPPAGAFLVARAADRSPVGGVGLRPHTLEIGVVKRLWVDPAWRRQGIARVLMDGLEGAARDGGFASLRLETGSRQPEAAALYAATGWERQHEDWSGGPIHPGSIHFTKDLA